MAALLGPAWPGLSPATISRLKEAWQARDLAGKRDICFRVDGVYVNARLDQERQRFRIVTGADAQGYK